MKGYSIIDRDYKSDDLVADIIKKSQQKQVKTHVWNLHELENYLLIPEIIERIVNRQIDLKYHEPISNVKELIIESADEIRRDIEDSMSDVLIHRSRYGGNIIEASTANKQAREIVASNWNEWNKLIKMIPGKDILTTLKSKIQNKYNVSFSNFELAQDIQKNEIPSEIRDVLIEISDL